MNRRSFITQTLVGTAGVTFASGLNCKKHPKKPNILLILTDQQRYDSLGCYGNSSAITPNLDLLAQEGIRFKSAYVAQALCSPSRSAIMTGKFPHRTGVTYNNITLTDHTTSFPRLLHENGYVTGYIGKWHLGPKGEEHSVNPIPDYFDQWLGYDAGWGSNWWGVERKDLPPEYAVPVNSSHKIPDFSQEKPFKYITDVETRQAIDFLKSVHHNPFFLCVSYNPPHPIWTAPKENCLRFYGKTEFPTYYAMVNKVDENVGQLLDTLDQTGLRENTIVIYTSDHGHEFIDRWNLPWRKRLCYDTSSRVPLIFNWKGTFPSGSRSALISLVDLSPTILDLCELDYNMDFHGKSAKNLLFDDDTENWRDSVFIQNTPFGLKHVDTDLYGHHNKAMVERCIVTSEWKLILNLDRPPELYNRDQDPAEKKNLYRDASLQPVIDNLFYQLKQWALDVKDSFAYSKWIVGKPVDL